MADTLGSATNNPPCHLALIISRVLKEIVIGVLIEINTIYTFLSLVYHTTKYGVALPRYIWCVEKMTPTIYTIAQNLWKITVMIIFPAPDEGGGREGS